MLREIKRDNKRNFFKEFGEWISLSGIRLRAVKSYQKFNGKYPKTQNDMSIEIQGYTLAIQEKDLPLPIKIGEKIEVNEEKFEVLSIKKELCILEIDIRKLGD